MMGKTSDEGKHLANIKTGFAVEISIKGDRSENNPIQGIVSEILTHSSYHPYGIMVRLENGAIGRVNKVLSECPPTPNAPVHSLSKEIDLNTLIESGESEMTEFKSSALWSNNITDEERRAPTASSDVREFGKDASKIIIAKTIAGFLNTQGGNLVIGIKENKNGGADEIIGIDTEFSKLKDKCNDGYRRMIVDNIIRKFFHPNIYNHFSDYIKITFFEIDSKMLCWIQIAKSKIPAFLTIQKHDYFYIRMDAETRLLDGSEMLEYCEDHFKK